MSKSIEVFEDTFWDAIVSLPQKEYEQVLKQLEEAFQQGKLDDTHWLINENDSQ